MFDEDRYFDVIVEYAKASPDDIVHRLTVANRGPEAAPLNVLPTLWFRNTWSWGRDGRGLLRPNAAPGRRRSRDGASTSRTRRSGASASRSSRARRRRAPELLFTENETNAERLFGAPNRSAVREGRLPRVRRPRRGGRRQPARWGTKAAAFTAW